ncbi:ATP-binding protein [Mesorhizobium retamae]|uniref:histidine kinase n=1 Tax=Mesorhizobium retamae TaxID=2912854 RepID=A0ABS9QNH0_9HYPH|nr:ATP-binding protein [Mesorhizobium sp. IRAMC:0171]MCG7508988.1 ATP-binding protein [Mesorhizobium sp. IRAMC:0171]
MTMHRTWMMMAYWVGAAIIAVIAGAGTGTLIITDHRNSYRNAEREAATLAAALAEHGSQVFARLDALSRTVVDDRGRGKDLPPAFSDRLGERIAAEPAARGITVIDSAGKVVATTIPMLSIGSDMTASPAFRIFTSQPERETFIGPPYLFLMDIFRGWVGSTLSYSRRVVDDQGQFLGFVAIVVDGPFLYSVYDRLEGVDDKMIGLIGQDGVVRASNNRLAIGLDIRDLVPEKAAQQESARFFRSPFDGREYLIAYERSSTTPLLSYVGVPISGHRLAWQRNSATTLGAFVVLCGTLGAVGYFLNRQNHHNNRLMASMMEAARERHEREFLQAVLNTGGALVVVTDENGALLVCNPVFRRKIDPEHVPGNVSLLEFLFGSPLHKLARALPLETIVTMADRQGEKAEFSWTLNAIRSGDGAIRNFVAIGFDNTSRRNAELAVYQAGKLITLGEMATGLAHEINQPIATIGMIVDVLRNRLRKGVIDGDFLQRKLITMNEQIERTVAIVDHMRIFGRRSERELEVFDPVDAVEGALTILGAEIRNAAIRVHRNYVGGACRVFADRLLLEQVVLNLLRNAIDAIAARRENLTGDPRQDEIIISVRNQAPVDVIDIEIGDTGTGIDRAHIERIFDPFFTTKSFGKGTGLGLPLSFGMVRDMGGRIEASNTDYGAAFTVRLPSSSSDASQYCQPRFGAEPAHVQPKPCRSDVQS